MISHFPWGRGSFMLQRLLLMVVLLIPGLLHAAATTKREQNFALQTILMELDTHYGMIDFKKEDLGITLEDLERKYSRLINEAKTLEEDLGQVPVTPREVL